MQPKNILLELSFKFSKRLIKCYTSIKDYSIRHSIGQQLLRSGTAVGALAREAQDAQSSADFIHKLSIALKESGETIYWLDLLEDIQEFSNGEVQSLKEEAKSLHKILTSIIISTKQNKKN